MKVNSNSIFNQKKTVNFGVKKTDSLESFVNEIKVINPEIRQHIDNLPIVKIIREHDSFESLIEKANQNKSLLGNIHKFNLNSFRNFGTLINAIGVKILENLKDSGINLKQFLFKIEDDNTDKKIARDIVQVAWLKKYRLENKERLKEYRLKNKEIINERNRKYYSDNKEIIKERKRKYRLKNIEIIREHDRKYYSDNKEIIKERNRKYKLKNKEKINERKREYRLKNIEIIREREKKYRLKNIERLKEYSRKYRLKNKETIRERNRRYYLNQKDIKVIEMLCNLKNNIYNKQK